MNYYSHHIGDYIKSTAYLTNEEDLAYRRLIELYYDTEKPIGLDDDLTARRIRSDLFTVSKVLAEYFTKTKDGWRNKRCDLEIRQYHLKVKANRINGKLGGRPRKTQSVSKTQVVSERLATGNPTETQHEPNLTLTKNQEPRTKNHIKPTVAALPDWIPLDAWEGFCEMRKKSKTAFTERAKTLLIGELLKLKDSGQDVGKVLDQSTANGWKGVFAVKSNGNGKGHTDWWASNEGIQAKAQELGIESRKGESWNDLKARVNQAIGV